MAINNCFPFVNIIIEIILSAVNGYNLAFLLFIEFICYLGISIVLIRYICNTVEFGERCLGCGVNSAACLIVIFFVEVYIYFTDDDYEKVYPDEFINLIAKIRIVGTSIAFGNIIIFSIIAKLCYKRLGFSNN